MQPANNDSGAGLPRIMTVEETARFLRLGRTTTYELCRQNLIPHLRLGHQIRISRDTLLAWLESGGLQEDTLSKGTEAAGLWEVRDNGRKPNLTP